MPLRLSRYTAPTAEPIHLTEAKIHLRLAVDAAGAVAYESEDQLLSGLIAAARDTAEVETWKALVFQAYDLYLDGWPAADEIKLPYPPLRKVDSIEYTLTDGTVNTFAYTEYTVDADSTPGRIVLGYEKSWPSDTLAPMNPIKIRFWCGYAVPFTATAADDRLTAANHPFADGDKVRLSVSGGTLPSGLSTMTDYFVRDADDNTLKLATAIGSAAVNLGTAGSGTMFIGEIPQTTIIGMKLILTDLHEERGNTVIGRFAGAVPAQLPRAASHFFAMDSAKEF